MRILKRYKDETGTIETTFAEERERLEAVYKDPELLIVAGSKFQTPMAYYEVVATDSPKTTIG